MRIGCLQFAPVKGDVNNNLRRADSVLLKERPQDLDLLVLPELAFTGNYFKSPNEIFPHLEPTNAGTSSLWARTVALRYDCTVVVGYPEKADATRGWQTSPECHNSAVIINGDGEVTGGYRKSHLHSIDETWALEGQGGFFTGDVAGVKNTMLGISMDITPYRFEAPWNAFEFANRVVQVRSNLVIVSLAWDTNQDGRLFSREPQEPDMDTLMHWVSRLEPIIRTEGDEEVIVVFANRTGSEDGVTYAGTSAVLGIRGGEVSLYGILGRCDRGLLVVDTEKEPYGKLIYRPEADGVPSESSQPFYNSTATPPSKTSTPTPPPPPAALPRSHQRVQMHDATPEKPSKPPVRHAIYSPGMPTPAPMMDPWDASGFSRTKPMTDNYDSAYYSESSTARASSGQESSPHLDERSGSSASSRRQPPVHTAKAQPAPVTATTATTDKTSCDRQTIERTRRLDVAEHHRVDALERLVFQEKEPAASLPQLLPLAYAAPKPQRVKDLSPTNSARVHSPPSCTGTSRRERVADTSGSSITSRLGRESHGGPHPPAAMQPASRTTTPAYKSREQSRNRSRTHTPAETIHATRPPSRTESRSTSGRPNDLSRSRLIEERPSEDFTIHRDVSRLTPQGHVPQQTFSTPSTHNRPVSARRQRTMPNQHNLETSNVAGTPPPVRKVTTKPSPGVFDSSPYAAPRLHSPAKRDEQSKPLVQTSPTSASVSPILPHFDFGSIASFQHAGPPDRMPWVESWLPTLSIYDQEVPSVSPLPSPKTPTRDPSTPRAMESTHEWRESEYPAFSLVGTLESMVKVPEFGKAW